MDYFAQNYGWSNIAYASVHLDERTPHMHMGIVPMRNGKLSSKAMFTREELKKIQDELPKHMRSYGFKLQRGEPGSEKKHKTVAEFKKEVANKELGQELVKEFGAPEFINEVTRQFEIREAIDVRETTLREKIEWVRERVSALKLSQNEAEAVLGQFEVKLEEKRGEVAKIVSEASQSLQELDELKNSINTLEMAKNAVVDELEYKKGFVRWLDNKAAELQKIKLPELESGIKTLTEQKNALEGKIEVLDNEILSKEEHRDSLVMEVMSFEETTLPRLRREAQELLRSRESLLDGFEQKLEEIVQETKKDLPEASGSALDVAFIRELGYEGVDDLVLRNQSLSGIVSSYRGLWEKIKGVLQDVTMMNALKKAKEVWELVASYKEPRLDPEARERLARAKAQVQSKNNAFGSRLEDAIEQARQEQIRQAKDMLDRRQPRKDWNGPSL